MAKDRALRRAEREREEAIRAAARAAEAERRERRAARKRAVRSALPRFGVGPHQGILLRRRRLQNSLINCDVLTRKVIYKDIGKSL